MNENSASIIHRKQAHNHAPGNSRPGMGGRKGPAAPAGKDGKPAGSNPGESQGGPASGPADRREITGGERTGTARRPGEDRP